jgi:hypothetical protein
MKCEVAELTLPEISSTEIYEIFWDRGIRLMESATSMG